jgi:hypothetical protein
MKGAGLWQASLGLLAFGAAAGCSADSASFEQRGGGGGPAEPAASSTPTPCSEVDPGLAERDSAELFTADHVPAFDLHLPADVWEELKLHARDEQYVPAQACYEGKLIGEIGLRFKGAYGSLRNCFDAAGQNTCRKLGIKLKFDEYVPEQRLFGLKRLNFQGNRYDDSYLKERLSYDLYREMDVAAPRAAWAVVRVNGVSEGLFGMVEEVDGRFTKKRWPDAGDGNLYKEVWPGQTSESWTRDHLKTNEDSGNIQSMLAFSAALGAAPEAALADTLRAYMDLDHFARYMAVDDAIGNFDGITTYYTSGSPEQAGNHNFYLYEQAPGRFTIIPWDLESTFSLSSGFGDVPAWQTLPADCTQTYPVWGGANQVIAPGCDRVFRALAADLGSYREAARRLLDGPLAEEALSAKIDELASFIRAEASADAHGPGAARFESAVQWLKQEVPRLRRRLEHLRSGEPSIPLVIDVGGVTDFESADNYGIYEGTTLLSNPNSTTSVEVGRNEPIGGAQSLRIVFDYGNELQPWNQWSFFRIPVAAVKDLSQLTGMRFKARANVARPLRLDVDSPKNSRAAQGVQVGWDIALTAEVKEFSVELAAAKTPSWTSDPHDDLPTLLRTVTGFSFRPGCIGTDATGQLADGARDRGWVEIDDIELY